MPSTGTGCSGAPGGGRVLYLGPAVLSGSETFIGREALALERLGVAIDLWSVHGPEGPLFSEETRALAGRCRVLYPLHPIAVGGALCRCLAARPGRTLATLLRALRDAFGASGLRGLRPRLAAGFHALAGLRLADRARGAVHVHAHFAHLPATIGMYAAHWLGVPFSFTAHANDLFVEATLLGRKLARARFAACISEHNRTFLRGLLPEGGAELLIVRCGIDPRAFPARPDPAPSPLGALLAVGRLVEKKGFHVLLEALALLRAKGREPRLELCGWGPEEGRLRALAARLGLSDTVRFRGKTPQETVRALLRESDLFVLPCVRDARGDMDGIPVALMEAMACQVPVLSTRISGIPELIVDGRSGRLAAPGDPDDLARVLAELDGDPAGRLALARGGRARVLEEFTLEGNAERLASVLCPGLASGRDAVRC